MRVVNETTLLIPDYPGNNRIESLRNIVRDPRIALHFLVPGCGDTLRVKGTAAISVDPELLMSFAAENGRAPKAVVVVTITSAYYHCGMAIKRAGLWDSLDARRARDTAERERDAGARAMEARARGGRRLGFKRIVDLNAALKECRITRHATEPLAGYDWQRDRPFRNIRDV